MDFFEAFEQQLIDERNGGSLFQYAAQPVDDIDNDLPQNEAEQEDS